MGRESRIVFVTGGTGYLGGKLLPLLRDRGHRITALARPGSADKLPAGIRGVPGDALDPASLRSALGDCDTWVQLIGTPHPAPWKAARFRAVDLRAVTASLEALSGPLSPPGHAIRHYVYLSVAQPAPVMRAYVEVRREAEAHLRAAVMEGKRRGIPRTSEEAPENAAPGLAAATLLRPWYVLGPGHRWAYALLPVYKLLEILPATRAVARRTGLVTLDQMLNALVRAVEHSPASVEILDVPAIRQARI